MATTLGLLETEPIMACRVCLNAYNLDSRLPVVHAACGYGLCSSCSTELAACPSCHQEIGSPSPNYPSRQMVDSDMRHPHDPAFPSQLRGVYKGISPVRRDDKVESDPALDSRLWDFMGPGSDDSLHDSPLGGLNTLTNIPSLSTVADSEIELLSARLSAAARLTANSFGSGRGGDYVRGPLSESTRGVYNTALHSNGGVSHAHTRGIYTPTTTTTPTHHATYSSFGSRSFTSNAYESPFGSVSMSTCSPPSCGPIRPPHLEPRLPGRPRGYVRMPRDPETGRLICYYYNFGGCTNQEGCDFAHVRVDPDQVEVRYHDDRRPARRAASAAAKARSINSALHLLGATHTHGWPSSMFSSAHTTHRSPHTPTHLTPAHTHASQSAYDLYGSIHHYATSTLPTYMQ